MRYHPMAEVEPRGWDAVLEDVIKEDREAEYIFISWDVDVMDPAFVLGTGTPYGPSPCTQLSSSTCPAVPPS